MLTQTILNKVDKGGTDKVDQGGDPKVAKFLTASAAKKVDQFRAFDKSDHASIPTFDKSDHASVPK